MTTRSTQAPFRTFEPPGTKQKLEANSGCQNVELKDFIVLIINNVTNQKIIYIKHKRCKSS